MYLKYAKWQTPDLRMSLKMRVWDWESGTETESGLELEAVTAARSFGVDSNSQRQGRRRGWRQPGEGDEDEDENEDGDDARGHKRRKVNKYCTENAFKTRREHEDANATWKATVCCHAPILSPLKLRYLQGLKSHSS